MTIEVIEDHIRNHIADPSRDPDPELAKGAQELAAFIHVASEMAFILNSARLLPTSGRGRPDRLSP